MKYIAPLVAGALLFASAALAAAQVETPTNIAAPGLEATGNVEAQVQTSQGQTIEIETKAAAETDNQRVLPTVNKKTTTKVTVRGWDMEKKEQIEAKIQTALEHNPQITNLEVSENSVLVKYGATAKLFGFIPMTMNINVEADANANVKVKFPWYKFMVTSYFSNAAELLNGVFQNNQSDLEFLRSKAAEDRQVEIFIRISNSLKAMHEMSKPIIQNIKA